MRILETQEYLDQACAMLAEGAQSVPVPVTGNSMRPFLRPGDTAHLERPEKPLKKGDIVLFSRPGGAYILHRIVGIRREGSFLILGDNQTLPEPVDASRIHGVVARVCRDGKTVKPGSPVWWFYAHPWRILAPYRPQIAQIRKRENDKL